MTYLLIAFGVLIIVGYVWPNYRHYRIMKQADEVIAKNRKIHEAASNPDRSPAEEPQQKPIKKSNPMPDFENNPQLFSQVINAKRNGIKDVTKLGNWKEYKEDN